jgi:hypothetical protein
MDRGTPNLQNPLPGKIRGVETQGGQAMAAKIHHFHRLLRAMAVIAIDAARFGSITLLKRKPT